MPSWVAFEHNVDFILSTELGATSLTRKPQGARYDMDWSVSTACTNGTGVGAFFDAPWSGSWVALKETSVSPNMRFYLVGTDAATLLIGVFYAPHQGHGVKRRLTYYKQLHAAWRRVCLTHPNARRILAGDANLPGLLYEGQR